MFGLSEMSSDMTGIPQRETQHVKELDPVLEYWFRVVIDEEVAVNGCNPEAMPLVESKLIAKCAGTYLYLTCARFTEEVYYPFQERCAIAGLLMGWLYSDAHQLMCTCANWLNDTCAYNSPIN